MATIISLKNQPTFDLTQFHFVTNDLDIILKRGCLFVETDGVFHFDHAYALVVPRSRVLRIDKNESERVVSIVCATIDSGFTGKLVWKIVLTPFALDELRALAQTEQLLPRTYQDYFFGAQQLMLFPSPSGNYYNGSNQTNLIPDIIFNNE